METPESSSREEGFALALVIGRHIVHQGREGVRQELEADGGIMSTLGRPDVKPEDPPIDPFSELQLVKVLQPYKTVSS